MQNLHLFNNSINTAIISKSYYAGGICAEFTVNNWKRLIGEHTSFSSSSSSSSSVAATSPGHLLFCTRIVYSNLLNNRHGCWCCRRSFRFVHIIFILKAWCTIYLRVTLAFTLAQSRYVKLTDFQIANSTHAMYLHLAGSKMNASDTRIRRTTTMP